MFGIFTQIWLTVPILVKIGQKITGTARENLPTILQLAITLQPDYAVCKVRVEAEERVDDLSITVEHDLL